MVENPFKTIRMRKCTIDKLTLIAKALNKPKSAFLNELVENLYDISSDFKNSNVMYSGSFIDGKLIIIFTGSRMPMGNDGQNDVDVKAKVEKGFESD